MVKLFKGKGRSSPDHIGKCKGKPSSDNTNNKIYLVLKGEDLPSMLFYRYFWFWSEYILRVFLLLKFNFINLRYGRLKDFFSKALYIIVHTPKMINFDYNRIMKDKFDLYDSISHGYI